MIEGGSDSCHMKANIGGIEFLLKNDGDLSTDPISVEDLNSVLDNTKSCSLEDKLKLKPIEMSVGRAFSHKMSDRVFGLFNRMKMIDRFLDDISKSIIDMMFKSMDDTVLPIYYDTGDVKCKNGFSWFWSKASDKIQCGVGYKGVNVLWIVIDVKDRTHKIEKHHERISDHDAFLKDMVGFTNSFLNDRSGEI